MRILCLLLLLPLSVFAQEKGYWNRANTSIPGPFGISVVDSTGLIYLDTSFSISTSSDGGNSWSALSLYHLPQNNLHFFPLNISTYFGFQSDSAALFKSIDAGATWKKIYEIKDSLLFFLSLTMWNASSGFLSYKDIHNQYHDLVTHDGGGTFIDFHHDSLFHLIPSFKSIWTDSLNGLLFYPGASGNNNKILVTHNGAKDWTVVEIPSPSGDAVRFATSQPRAFNGTYTLLDKAPKPYFYFSTDYGDHWSTSDTTDMPTYITGLAQNGKNSFWAWGKNSKSGAGMTNLLLYTKDFGKHWISDMSFKDYGSVYLDFPDSLHGYAPEGDVLYKYSATSSAVFPGKEVSTEIFQIYPNPCKDILKIKSEIPFVKFHIVNLLGQIVLSSEDLQTNVDVSQLSHGIYTIEVLGSNGMKSLKSFFKN
jgi:hypothetical protein